MNELFSQLSPDSICLQYLAQIEKTIPILMEFQDDIRALKSSEYIQIMSPPGESIEEQVYYVKNHTDTVYVFTKP